MPFLVAIVRCTCNVMMQLFYKIIVPYSESIVWMFRFGQNAGFYPETQYLESFYTACSKWQLTVWRKCWRPDELISQGDRHTIPSTNYCIGTCQLNDERFVCQWKVSLRAYMYICYRNMKETISQCIMAHIQSNW